MAGTVTTVVINCPPHLFLTMNVTGGRFLRIAPLNKKKKVAASQVINFYSTFKTIGVNQSVKSTKQTITHQQTPRVKDENSEKREDITLMDRMSKDR